MVFDDKLENFNFSVFFLHCANLSRNIIWFVNTFLEQKDLWWTSRNLQKHSTAALEARWILLLSVMSGDEYMELMEQQCHQLNTVIKRISNVHFAVTPRYFSSKKFSIMSQNWLRKDGKILIGFFKFLLLKLSLYRGALLDVL